MIRPVIRSTSSSELKVPGKLPVLKTVRDRRGKLREQVALEPIRRLTQLVLEPLGRKSIKVTVCLSNIDLMARPSRFSLFMLELVVSGDNTGCPFQGRPQLTTCIQQKAGGILVKTTRSRTNSFLEKVAGDRFIIPSPKLGIEKLLEHQLVFEGGQFQQSGLHPAQVSIDLAVHCFQGNRAKLVGCVRLSSALFFIGRVLSARQKLVGSVRGRVGVEWVERGSTFSGVLQRRKERILKCMQGE